MNSVGLNDVFERLVERNARLDQRLADALGEHGLSYEQLLRASSAVDRVAPEAAQRAQARLRQQSANELAWGDLVRVTPTEPIVSSRAGALHVVPASHWIRA
jgi:hypothetical protein